jgi:hypothetical protein
MTAMPLRQISVFTVGKLFTAQTPRNSHVFPTQTYYHVGCILISTPKLRRLSDLVRIAQPLYIVCRLRLSHSHFKWASQPQYLKLQEHYSCLQPRKWFTDGG